jgi:hypothetical protein
MEQQMERQSFTQDTQRFSPHEIRIGGDLHRALAPRNDNDVHSEPLAQRGVIGCRNARDKCLGVRALDHIARKCLRGLNPDEIRSIDCLDHGSSFVHALECIDNREAWGRASTLPRFRDDVVDHFQSDQRTRGIVHDDDREITRKILESVPHRVAALASSNGEKKSLGVALKEPWRRITDVLVRQDDDDESDILTLLKCLNAVQKHRLSRNPSELLELRSTGARSFSAGDNYHADVTVH